MIWVEDTCFCGAQSVSKVNVVHVGNTQPSASGVGQDTRCYHGKSFLQWLGSWAGWILWGAFHYIELGHFPGAVSWDKHSTAEMEECVYPALSKPKRGEESWKDKDMAFVSTCQWNQREMVHSLLVSHLPLHFLLWINIAPSISCNQILGRGC